ncbi:MAG: transglutaminase-like domain-containing protein [Alphaproteobacteria bacterium]
MKRDMSQAEAEARRAIEAALDEIGKQPDAAINLAESALTLASLDVPELKLDPYRRHLAALVRDVAGVMADPTAESRTAALSSVIAARWGYKGDSDNYDDIANAALPRVIDRRKGLPVSLGVLYIHVARGEGWPIAGLNFPGHFLVRLEGRDGERLILDPFNGGRILGIDELRRLLKVAEGMDAELMPEHYEPVTNRDILLRLQNNLRMRLFRMGEVRRAASVTESMLRLAPLETALWREAGVLYAELGEVGSAISALERFLDSSGSDTARHQAAALLQKLRGSLH